MWEVVNIRNNKDKIIARVRLFISIALIGLFLFLDYNNYYGLIGDLFDRGVSKYDVKLIDSKINHEGNLYDIAKDKSIIFGKGDIYISKGGYEFPNNKNKKGFMSLEFRRNNDIPSNDYELLITERNVNGTKMKYLLTDPNLKKDRTDIEVLAPYIIVKFEKNDYFYRLLLSADDLIDKRLEVVARTEDYTDDIRYIDDIEEFIKEKIKDL